jgi:hypothetical protein
MCGAAPMIVEGELRGGGPGYTFVTYRFLRSSLGQLFPSGNTAMVGGWSEVQNSQYPNFAYDPIMTVHWVLP